MNIFRSKAPEPERAKAAWLYVRLVHESQELDSLRSEFYTLVKEFDDAADPATELTPLRVHAAQFHEVLLRERGRLIEGQIPPIDVSEPAGRRLIRELGTDAANYAVKTDLWLQVFTHQGDDVDMATINHAASAAQMAGEEMARSADAVARHYGLTEDDLLDATGQGHS
jgi:hypothetical protein